MKALAATEEASIKIKDVIISQEGGDGKMSVTYGGDNAQIEYQKTWDLSKANVFTFEATNKGESDAQLHLIFKLTDSWTWTPVNDDDGACVVPAGESVTCTYDISSLADRNKTLSVVVANYAKGYTGTILYDNFKAGDQVLWDFNEDKYDAFSRGFENTEEMIPEIKIVFDGSSGLTSFRSASAKTLLLNGNTISLSMARSADVTAELFDVTGHRVATLHRGTLSAGSHSFGLSAAKGTYFVKVKGLNINIVQKITLK
jgi:hypothetical protein